MRTFILKDSVFHTKIYVYVCSRERYNTVARRQHWGEENDVDTLGRFSPIYEEGKSKYVIWIRSSQTKWEIRKTLAHELIHLVFRRFKDIGVGTTIKNDEVFAYFYESLLVQGLDFLK